MSHREWNPKSFFRHLTADALGLLRAWAEVDFQLDGDGPVGEQAYRAWKALAESERQWVEAELLLVNDLCAEHARPYLEQLAARLLESGRGRGLEGRLGYSTQDLAVRLFVADSKGFAEAHQAYSVDSMEYLKEYRGTHPVAARPGPEAKARMKAAMASHFRDTLGGRCQVEDFANDEKLALFVLHEDVVTPVERFNQEGVVEPDWQRPVIRLAAIFNYETSTLYVKAARTAEREKLKDLFADVLLGAPGYFEDGGGKRPQYRFDVLGDADFDFPTRGVDGVAQVSVIRLSVRPGRRVARRVTVELVPGLSLREVRDVLAGYGVHLLSDTIEGVRLQFRFEGRGRSKSRTISLVNPNSTNLNDTERDRVIRQYLREWGIDASGRRETVAPAAGQAALH